MGEISDYFRDDAPKKVRKAIENGKKDQILDPDYPYRERMDRGDYEDELAELQIELVKFQHWVKEIGARVVMLFEGRDAAGKGGTIKRFREYLNPRGARVVALSKPSDVERGQWYFQRYIQHLPTAGEIVFFDRSWYNRAVVERVFAFSTDNERDLFFRQTPEFEDAITNDGVHLFKFWLTCGRAEQLRRFIDRESSPLKRWKLSPIDFKSLDRWDAYSEAIEDMFLRTHNPATPWTIIRSDDKRRARIAAIRAVLSRFDYPDRTKDAARPPDPKITGAPGQIPVDAD